MRKNDITQLVAIQGFSVRKTEFDREEIKVEIGEKEEKFYHKKKHRAKVMRKVPKKVIYLIPRVDIYLERNEAVYRCSGCGREYCTYDHSEPYTARDLPYGKWKSAWIHFDKVYVACEKCGIRVEALGWIDSRVRYTKRLAEEVAWECRLIQSIKTVAKRFHLHWKTVKEIDKAALGRELNPPDFSGVRKLAVDEISIKKRHKYATVVADAERHRVLWVIKDRKEASLLEFYDQLGKEGCKKIEAVAMDMWKPYEAATKARCPNAAIVYDRFHIEQGFKRVIDAVRRQEYAKVTGQERRAIKGLMYLLYTRPRNLKSKDRQRLNEAFKLNRRLFTVYMLQEELSHLWSYTYAGAAVNWFQRWYSWAIRTRIEPVKSFARNLKTHLNGILAHCKHKISTSFLEGMNNKIKVIKRIAFGYRDFEYFFLKIRGAFLWPALPGV